MNKGDVVKVIDGSWSTNIKGMSLGSTGNLLGRSFVVIALDCDVPSTEGGHKNDAIIKCCTTREVVFIASKFLRVKKQFCEYCGQRLEKCEI